MIKEIVQFLRNAPEVRLQRQHTRADSRRATNLA